MRWFKVTLKPDRAFELQQRIFGDFSKSKKGSKKKFIFQALIFRGELLQ